MGGRSPGSSEGLAEAKRRGRAREQDLRADWLAEHPGRPLPEHLCSLTEAQEKELDEWLEGKPRHQWLNGMEHGMSRG